MDLELSLRYVSGWASGESNGIMKIILEQVCPVGQQANCFSNQLHLEAGGDLEGTS